MPNMVEGHLDRALVSSAWLSLFPHAKLLNGIAPISDHSPLIQPGQSVLRRFKSENAWLQESDI